MRVLITQVATFKKDLESVRVDEIRLLDQASVTMDLATCKMIAEAKNVTIIPYGAEEDLLFRLGQIINKNDTFVMGSLYNKLPKSVLAEYKIEQIGKKAKAPAKAPVKKPTTAVKKETAPAPKKPITDEAKKPAGQIEWELKTPTTEAKTASKKPAAKKSVMEAKPAVAEPAPATPKKPRKRKGEDVSAYVEAVGKYVKEVTDDDLVFVIRTVRESVKSTGDDRMAKGYCKSKLKKEFGEELGTAVYNTVEEKFASIKSAAGM